MWDFVREVFIDPALDAQTAKLILVGFLERIGDEVQREFLELTDEELNGRVAELYGIVQEAGDPSFTPLATWYFQHVLPEKETDDLSTVLLFGNPLLTEDVLSFVVRTDPTLSLSDSLVRLVRGNVRGSRLYALERIRPFVKPPALDRSSISTFIELAIRIGDEESLGFLVDVLTTEYVPTLAAEARNRIPATVSEEEYRQLLREECNAAAEYRERLKDLHSTPYYLDIGKMNEARRFNLALRLREVTGMEEMERGAVESLFRDRVVTPRHIKFLETLRFMESNKTIAARYGPINLPRLFSASAFGSQNPELPRFPPDVRTYRMQAFPERWFRGICDYCYRIIPLPQLAFRTPLVEDGGWEGCFCSERCSISQMLAGPEYGIPRDEVDGARERIDRQIEQFLAGNWSQALLLIRDFPIIQNTDDGQVLSNARARPPIRPPKIIVVPAREERVEDHEGDETWRGIAETAQGILEELGLDESLLGDDAPPVKYTPEIILKRPDLERYALTSYMNMLYASNTIAIPPSTTS